MGMGGQVEAGQPEWTQTHWKMGLRLVLFINSWYSVEKIHGGKAAF